MSTPEDLQRYIRYQLAQLSTKNEHHRFEDLCRAFTRARICTNVLPATGPVSAGGDQGHDFETFRTHLQLIANEPISYLGTSGTKKLVFACTLQQTGLPRKIRSDVDTIIKHCTEKPDTIYAFCEANIKISVRHQLQQEVEETHGVHLEIIDGHALAEQLASTDILWIPSQYLGLPAELFPYQDTEDPDYHRYRKRWITEAQSPQTYRDFYEIKYGLRRSTFDTDHRADLSNWIDMMAVFLKEGDDRAHLPIHAAYEICVARLRGQNTLDTSHQLLQWYFPKVASIGEVLHLKDAATLAMYCAGAHGHGALNIDQEQVEGWIESIDTCLHEILSTHSSGAIACEALAAIAHLSFARATLDGDIDTATSRAFHYWNELLHKVPNVPLFPIEGVVDIFSVMSPHLVHYPDFKRLTSAFDDLLQERTGAHRAADKAKDRALTLLHSDNVLPAVFELHRVKEKWFSGETITGSIRTMLFLAECYQRLRLPHAAHYYSSCAFYLSSQHDPRDLGHLFAQSAFAYLESSYFAGDWLEFLRVGSLTLLAHIHLDEEPFQIDQHPALQRFVYYLTIVRTVAHLQGSPLDQHIAAVYESLPMPDWFRDEASVLLDDAQDQWGNWTFAEFVTNSSGELAGRPFNDADVEYCAAWSALGVVWRVNADNSRSTFIAVREVAASLQLLCAELADTDMVLLPTTVHIRVDVTNVDDARIEEDPSQGPSHWTLRWPRKYCDAPQALNEIGPELISVAAQVFVAVSLLDTQRMMDTFSDLFAQGMPNRILFGASFKSMLDQIYPADEFQQDSAVRSGSIHSGENFDTTEADPLSAFCDPGPGYSHDQSLELIRGRYANCAPMTRKSLPFLLEFKEVTDAIRQWREEGLKDWYIWQILANILMNEHIGPIYGQEANYAQQKMASMIGKDEEESIQHLPSAFKDPKELQFQRWISAMAVAKRWGLHVKVRVPDMHALEKVLAQRYMLFEDDVEHTAPF